MTIARDRWQHAPEDPRRSYYHDQAARAGGARTRARPAVGAGVAALALHALAEVLERAPRRSGSRATSTSSSALGELIACGRGRGGACAAAPRAPRGRARRRRPTARFDAGGARRASAASSRARRRSRWRSEGVALGRRRRRRRRRRASPASPRRARPAARSSRRRPACIADMDLVADALYERDAAADRRRRLDRRPRGRSPWKTRPTAPSPSSVSARSCPTPRRAAPSGTTSRAGATASREVAADRWDPALYYDPDPQGAATRPTRRSAAGSATSTWDPLQWKLPIPPRVAAAMDDGAEVGGRGRARGARRLRLPRPAARPRAHRRHPRQRHGRRAALPDRAAHRLPRVRARARGRRRRFAALPGRRARRDRRASCATRIARRLPDDHRGHDAGRARQLIAGRVANLFNFHGPNFITDAACASALAAIERRRRRARRAATSTPCSPAASTATWAPSTFVKFCKIGALSADRHAALRRRRRRLRHGRGRGALPAQAAGRRRARRRPDLRRDPRHRRLERRQGQGHHRAEPGRASASRSQRAWERAGLVARRPSRSSRATAPRPRSATSSRSRAWSRRSAAPGCPPQLDRARLGEVEHRPPEGRAPGAAGLLKAALALHHKVAAARASTSATPNPDIDFARSPFYVNTELRPWATPAYGVRAAPASRAFGFGGTNFHVVLEEHVPGRAARKRGRRPSQRRRFRRAAGASGRARAKAPLRGAARRSARPTRRSSPSGSTRGAARGRGGQAPAPRRAAPRPISRAPERVAIDFGDAAELADKIEQGAQGASPADRPARGARCARRASSAAAGPAPKVAFLFTGQGSQYVNMLARPARGRAGRRRDLRRGRPVMTPLLGRPLSSYIFVDAEDDGRRRRGRGRAASRPRSPSRRCSPPTSPSPGCSATYGIVPDMVMGHSLGEYGALVAAGVAAVRGRARGGARARPRDGARLASPTTGKMAAVFAPLAEIEQALDGDRRLRRRRQHQQPQPDGHRRRDRPRSSRPSSAFSEARRHGRAASRSATPSTPRSSRRRASRCRRVLERLRPRAAAAPGGRERRPASFYPTDGDVAGRCIDLLAQQVASPVQFVKGLETLYDAGARVFVEVGPKRALAGLRRGRARRPRRRASRSPPTTRSAGDVVVVQPGALRPLRRRPRRRGGRRARRRSSLRRPRPARAGPPPAPSDRQRRAPRLRARCARAGAGAGDRRRPRPPLRRVPRPRHRDLPRRGGPAPSTPRSRASRWSSPAPRSACRAVERVFDDANVDAHPRAATSSSTPSRTRIRAAQMLDEAHRRGWSRATTAASQLREPSTTPPR